MLSFAALEQTPTVRSIREKATFEPARCLRDFAGMSDPNTRPGGDTADRSGAAGWICRAVERAADDGESGFSPVPPGRDAVRVHLGQQGLRDVGIGWADSLVASDRKDRRSDSSAARDGEGADCASRNQHADAR